MLISNVCLGQVSRVATPTRHLSLLVQTNSRSMEFTFLLSPPPSASPFITDDLQVISSQAIRTKSMENEAISIYNKTCKHTV